MILCESSLEEMPTTALSTQISCVYVLKLDRTEIQVSLDETTVRHSNMVLREGWDLPLAWRNSCQFNPYLSHAPRCIHTDRASWHCYKERRAAP